MTTHPRTTNSGWLTQDIVAKQLDVTLTKVRPVVAALHRLGLIQTMTDPRDGRYLLIHQDSIPTLARALGIAEEINS